MPAGESSRKSVQASHHRTLMARRPRHQVRRVTLLQTSQLVALQVDQVWKLSPQNSSRLMPWRDSALSFSAPEIV